MRISGRHNGAKGIGKMAVGDKSDDGRRGVDTQNPSTGPRTLPHGRLRKP